MRCANCQNEIPIGQGFCDICGHLIQSGGGPPEPARSSDVASRRGRTEYDPGPAAPLPPGANRPRVQVFRPENPSPALKNPAIPDAFAGERGGRSAFDPSDPFAGAAGSSAAPPSPLMAPPGAISAAPDQKPRANATIVEKVVLDRIKGVLVEYRVATDPGRLHALRFGRNKIGRDPGSDVCLEEPRASQDHAYIYLREQGAVYQDTSRNGSKVQGEIVWGAQAALEMGSIIEIGETTLVLLLVPERAEVDRT